MTEQLALLAGIDRSPGLVSAGDWWTPVVEIVTAVPDPEREPVRHP
jgi:hypothetical protein